VVSTAVGYAGGKVANPSYYRMADHTECVRVTFDPRLISYPDILHTFWKSHDPTAQLPRQYQSVLLPHSPHQTEAAMSSLATRHSSRTRIEPLSGFTLAESQHQKYHLQRHPAIVRALGEDIDLVRSYVATRVNGYLAGRGSMFSFSKEWEGLGLSQKQAAYIRMAIMRRN